MGAFLAGVRSSKLEKGYLDGKVEGSPKWPGFVVPWRLDVDVEVDSATDEIDAKASSSRNTSRPCEPSDWLIVGDRGSRGRPTAGGAVDPRCAPGDGVTARWTDWGLRDA